MYYTQKAMDKDWNEYVEKQKSIKDRADQIVPVSEGLVTIQRVDIKEFETFLELDHSKKDQRERLCWYAKLLNVNPADTGDKIMNSLRDMLKTGDTICINPDTPYSLNIPGFPEIWVCLIGNIIAVDSAMNFDDLKRKQLQRRLDLAKSRT